MRVIRVVTHPNDLLAGEIPGHWLECFRYAGLVTVHKDEKDRTVFDIHAPRSVDDNTWASMNAKRMRSFGINAVDAPEWKY